MLSRTPPVSRFQKLIGRLLSGEANANIGFDDLRYVLTHLGFAEEIKGSHHMFTRDGIDEQANLQRDRNRKDAKPYQVRQVRHLIRKYNLTGGGEE